MKNFRPHLVALLLGFFCFTQKTFTQVPMTESELLQAIVGMEKANVEKVVVNDSIAKTLNQTIVFEIRDDIGGIRAPISPISSMLNAFHQYYEVLTNFNHFNLYLLLKDTILLGATVRHGLSSLTIDALMRSGFKIDTTLDLMTINLQVKGSLSQNLVTPTDSVYMKTSFGTSTALNSFPGKDSLFLYLIKGNLLYLEHENFPILEKLIGEKTGGIFPQGLYLMRVPPELVDQFPGMSGSPLLDGSNKNIGALIARVVLPFASSEGVLSYLLFSATQKSNF